MADRVLQLPNWVGILERRKKIGTYLSNNNNIQFFQLRQVKIFFTHTTDATIFTDREKDVMGIHQR